MLNISAAYPSESKSKGNILDSVSSSYAAAAPLVLGLRALFWASGLGGVAVAGVIAGALALDAQPARISPASVQRDAVERFDGTIVFSDRSSASKIVIATDAVSDGKVVSPLPFDISMYNDPEFVRNIEQLYNPWSE